MLPLPASVRHAQTLSITERCCAGLSIRCAQYSNIQFRAANAPRSEVDSRRRRAWALQARNNGLRGGKTAAAAAEHPGAGAGGGGLGRRWPRRVRRRGRRHRGARAKSESNRGARVPTRGRCPGEAAAADGKAAPLVGSKVLGLPATPQDPAETTGHGGSFVALSLYIIVP